MNFIKYKSGKIVYSENRKRSVNLEYLGMLLKEKKSFRVFSGITMEEITDAVLQDVKISLQKVKSKKKRKDPEEMEMTKPDMRKCNSCRRPTVNRFKCSICWGEIDSSINEDFIYFT